MIDPIQSEIDALLHGPGGDPSSGAQRIDFIRGPDGQIGGVQIGDMTLMVRRDANGQIAGFTPGGNPAPQQPEMPPASNQQPQIAALPSPFNGQR